MEAVRLILAFVPFSIENKKHSPILSEARLFFHQMNHGAEFLENLYSVPYRYLVAYTFTAYFLMGKVDLLRISFRFFLFAWKGVSALLIARVFFGLRSRGLYFLFLYNRRRFSFCFWCMIMYTLAIAFLTTRLKEIKRIAQLVNEQPGAQINFLLLSKHSFQRSELLYRKKCYRTKFFHSIKRTISNSSFK